MQLRCAWVIPMLALASRAYSARTCFAEATVGGVSAMLSRSRGSIASQPSVRSSLRLRSMRSLSMVASADLPASAPSFVAPSVIGSRRLCVAPMMDWTDKYDRYFLRQMSKHTWLYTEMVTCGAILHGGIQDRLLGFDPSEHPIAVQLGGSDPADLAKCAAIAEGYGYDEINLNVGCPSERVSSGSFGACLMAEPELVAECVAAMVAAVKVPVTVKHRIGIDKMQSYEELCHFVDTVHKGGCNTFIVHARIAILKGLSPKENRQVPPLKYEWVYQLKKDFPHLEIIINGGIQTLDEAEEHLQHVDGVMMGRAAYHQPFDVLSAADERIYDDGASGSARSRQEVMDRMIPFLEENLAAGVSLNTISRHMLGLFAGCKGGRAYRRLLAEQVHLQGSGLHTLLAAVQKVPEDIRLGAVTEEKNPKSLLPWVANSTHPEAPRVQEAPEARDDTSESESEIERKGEAPPKGGGSEVERASAAAA